MNDSVHSPCDTKDRILDAAERLFAENGIGATSLRAVTREAGVNLAAVHYHFGPKEALCQAVLARRVGPVNRERLRLLDEIESGAGADGPTVDAILRAFLEPVVRLKRDLGERGALWSTLIGRFYSEPAELVEPLMREQFQEVGRRFVEALARALPELPPAEVFGRFQLVIGVMIHSLSGLRRIQILPEFRDPSGDDAILPRLYEFLEAGLRAPFEASSKGTAAAPSKVLARS